ncbi:MAG: DUF3048 domain-containing protein [Coriobacteriia bacterium]|nr:DUF3048 domain-containing protein [Coriobacteriia bacterium]
MSGTKKVGLTIGAIVVIALIAVAVYALTSTEFLPEILDTKLPEKAEEVEETHYYWPLTGKQAPDGEIIGRRPISMKIDNHPDARPQTGLNDADIVYEIEVEGGLTRFHALFQSDLPEMAGPMRSARPSDIWVVQQWDSYLLFSGAADEVYEQLRNSGIDMAEESDDQRIFERVDWRIAPHNLYIHVDNVPQTIAEFGINPNAWPIRTLDFEDEPSDITAEIYTVTVPFLSSVATWVWDASTARFLRLQDGFSQNDFLTGEQTAAENVVILWGDYAYLDGGGLAAVFKDGVRYDGTWTTAAGKPPAIIDSAGTPITLKPGKTWFEVVSLDTPIDVVPLIAENVVE